MQEEENEKRKISCVNIILHTREIFGGSAISWASTTASQPAVRLCSSMAAIALAAGESGT